MDCLGENFGFIRRASFFNCHAIDATPITRGVFLFASMDMEMEDRKDTLTI
jgi:hypothetical protein